MKDEAKVNVEMDKRELVAYEHEYILVDNNANTSKVTSLSALNWDEFQEIRQECEGVMSVRQIASYLLIRANDFETAMIEAENE